MPFSPLDISGAAAKNIQGKSFMHSLKYCNICLGKGFAMFAQLMIYLCGCCVCPIRHLYCHVVKGLSLSIQWSGYYYSPNPSLNVKWTITYYTKRTELA